MTAVFNNNRRPGWAFIIALLAAMMVLMSVSSCAGIDTQPPQKEVVYAESNSPDTILVITSDTIGVSVVKDSSITIQHVNESPLLSSVEEVKSGVEVVDRVIPLDSLVRSVYMSQVGVHEATGKNDGKDVEKYLRSVGLTKGNAWCAAFVKWCFDQAGVRTTITGWSPTAHNPSNVVMERGSFKKEVQGGDVFTIYFPSLRRIGHTGFVNKRFGINSVETYEGNTNVAGSREGDGVYIKIRPKSSLYSITRWF